MEEEVDEVERKSEERREKREREREIEGEKRRSGFGGERGRQGAVATKNPMEPSPGGGAEYNQGGVIQPPDMLPSPALALERGGLVLIRDADKGRGPGQRVDMLGIG